MSKIKNISKNQQKVDFNRLLNQVQIIANQMIEKTDDNNLVILKKSVDDMINAYTIPKNEQH